MSDKNPQFQNAIKRTGAVPRPVQPIDAILDSVSPIDPLRLGVISFPLRRPATRRLLETEFSLTRKQAYALAVSAASHKPARRETRRAALIFWGLVIFAALVLGTIGGGFAYEQYQSWILNLKPGDPATAASVLLAVIITGVGIGLWFAAERWIMDSIVDREIRRCWGDQECIWCGRDMAGCTVDRERWGICPECGMRSPIGARATTI